MSTAPRINATGAKMLATTNINIRTSEQVRDLIDRGAAAVHKTRTEFMLAASAAAAQNALVDQTYFALSPAQMVEFERIMSEPLPDSAGVAKLIATQAP